MEDNLIEIKVQYYRIYKDHMSFLDEAFKTENEVLFVDGIGSYFLMLKRLYNIQNSEDVTYSGFIGNTIGSHVRTAQRKLQGEGLNIEELKTILDSSFLKLGFTSDSIRNILDGLFELLVQGEIEKGDYLSLPFETMVMHMIMLTQLVDFIATSRVLKEDYQINPSSLGIQEMIILFALKMDIMTNFLKCQHGGEIIVQSCLFYQLPKIDKPEFPLENLFKGISKAFNWTQQELANNLGAKDVREIRKWQTGQNRCSIPNLIKLVNNACKINKDMTEAKLKEELEEKRATFDERVGKGTQLSDIERLQKELFSIAMEQVEADVSFNLAKLKTNLFKAFSNSYVIHYFLVDLVKKHGKKQLLAVFDAMYQYLEQEVFKLNGQLKSGRLKLSDFSNTTIVYAHLAHLNRNAKKTNKGTDVTKK